MLHTISNQELEHLLTLDHPTWTPQAIAQQAEEYRNFLDDRLDAPLQKQESSTPGAQKDT